MVRLPERAAFFIIKNAGVNTSILIITNYAKNRRIIVDESARIN